MIDFAQAASFAELDWKEDRDQIGQMESARTSSGSPRYPVEEIQRRRARLKIKAQAVHIIRVVADSAVIQELVSEQLQARGKA